MAGNNNALIGRLLKNYTSNSNGYSDNNEVYDMKVQRIDHVGIIINDLPAAKAFF